jgi:hypothetical protein
LKSSITSAFRKQFASLPEAIQEQAKRAYALWRVNPYHPSLQFKCVSQYQPVFSVRIGIRYRALGLKEGKQVFWFWIGSHAEYDALLKRL